MLAVDILYEVLKDGETHTVKELLSKSGLKNKSSLKSELHWLRTMGYSIKHVRVNGHSRYVMLKSFKSDDYYPCMLKKDDWPVCHGQGCRHKDKCEAVPSGH